MKTTGREVSSRERQKQKMGDWRGGRLRGGTGGGGVRGGRGGGRGGVEYWGSW